MCLGIVLCTTLCSISIVTTGVEKMQERRGTDIRLIGIRELSVLHILHFGSKLNNYRALTRKPFYDVVQGKCFTCFTKTFANLTTNSRKPGDYNGTVIFETN